MVKTTKELMKEAFKMTDSQYDALKQLALIVLPALGALYFALGNLWGFPKVEEVLGTVTAIETFLGIVLGVSKKNYKANEEHLDGDLEVEITPDGDQFSLELDMPVEDVKTKDELTVKVKPNDSQE